MTPLFGALFLFAAIGALVFGFRGNGGSADPAAAAKTGFLGRTAPAGTDPASGGEGDPAGRAAGKKPGRKAAKKDGAPKPPVDANSPEAAKRRAMASSTREVHKLLADAIEKRIASNRRKGLARSLEQAGSQMRPGEFLVISCAMGVGGFLLGTILLNLLVGVIAGVFGFLLNRMLLKRKVSKRQGAFSTQVAETLQLLAGSLRAGQSLMQALANVAEDSPSPSKDEYRRVLAENRLGRDLTEAMYAMADRVGSEDFEWVVGAIDINRATGGDLAVILDRVIETLRQRDRLRGQVKALSAEGRFSGYVVSALPPGVFVFVWFTNREYMSEFTARPLGWLLLGVSLTLLLIGAMWLRRLAKPIY